MAVTGAHGRLGRAIVAELRRRGIAHVEWSRPDYDLDDPQAASRLIERDTPRLVVHCAAWTNVDGCATEPELAMRRNATAVGELAASCSDGGTDLALISTNEVFDGHRDGGPGYTEDDAVAPINPYGASKLAGERAAQFAMGTGRRLWIVRTAWLFGPPGNDFPDKILATADRLAPGEPLRVASDEHGSPTYTVDLAPALLDLVERTSPGTYHLAAPGAASRFDLAREITRRCHPTIELQRIGRLDFERASRPPAWGVLDSSRAAAHGIQLRPWPLALSEYLAGIC